MRHLVFLPLVLLLAGCVAPGGGETARRDYLFGLVMVDYAPEETSTVTDSRMAGLWVGKSNAGAGLRRHSEVRIHSECQVVFLIEDEAELAQARDLIESTLDMSGDEICIAEQ